MPRTRAHGQRGFRDHKDGPGGDTDKTVAQMRERNGCPRGKERKVCGSKVKAPPDPRQASEICLPLHLWTGR